MSKAAARKPIKAAPMRAAKKNILKSLKAYASLHENSAALVPEIIRHLQMTQADQRFEQACLLLNAKNPDGTPVLPQSGTIRALFDLCDTFDENQQNILTQTIKPLAKMKSDDLETVGQASLWMLAHFGKIGTRKDELVENVVATWEMHECTYEDICKAAACNGPSAGKILNKIDDAFLDYLPAATEKAQTLKTERETYRQSPAFKKLFPAIAF